MSQPLNNIFIKCFNNSLCISCNYHFFVGCNKLNSDLESGVHRVPVTPPSLCFELLVKLNAKTSEIVANLFTKLRLVFAETGGK
jgi:hypothetical protein